MDIVDWYTFYVQRWMLSIDIHFNGQYWRLLIYILMPNIGDCRLIYILCPTLEMVDIHFMSNIGDYRLIYILCPTLDIADWYTFYVQRWMLSFDRHFNGQHWMLLIYIYFNVQYCRLLIDIYFNVQRWRLIYIKYHH